MQTEVITAVIGAVGTVIVSLVGAYATIRVHDADIQGTEANRRKGALILVVGLLFAAGSLVAGFVFGASHQQQKEISDRKIKATTLTSSYESLIEAGLKDSKPYVMPQVVMLVNLDKSRDGKTIESNRKIVYGLQLLSDMSSDNPLFTEGYHSNYQVDRLPGADPESDDETVPSAKSWKVLLSGKSGDRHLVLTGAHVRMPIRLSTNHKYHMFSGLREYEDAFCYPNTEGDVIGEFVIAVESSTMELTLPTGGVDDAQFQRGSEIRRVEARQFTTVVNGHSHYLLTARFQKLAKGDVAGLRVRWKP